jgi:polysaccharide pyruvyl transferase WcaK-like protein
MKCIFVNDTTTQLNWGCHSTSYHSREFFNALGVEAEHTILLSTLQSNEKTEEQCNDVDLSDVQCVFVNGEGSIYGNQRKGLNIVESIKILKSRKPELKVFFMNSTFDVSEKNVKMRDAILESRQHVDYYFPREPVSEQILSNLSIENTMLQPDFLYHKALEQPEVGNYIVLGGNSNYYRPDRPKYNAKQAYSHLVRRLLKNNYEVVLYSSDKADLKFLPKIEEEFGLRHITCMSTPWREAFDVLSKAKFSISGRYHPSIMSLCGHTPCYFITANNCKMQGTHQFFYDDDSNITNSHQMFEEAIKIIKWLKMTEANYERETQRIGDGLKRIKKMLDDVFDLCTSLLS